MMRSDGRPLVALQIPSPGLPEALHDLRQEGAGVLPLPPALPRPELDTVLAHLRPAALVTPDGRQELPSPAPLKASTDLVVLTSGSTGRPKGVELTRTALDAAARMTTARLGCESGDRWLLCVLATRIAGLSILARSEMLGTEPHILERFDVEAFAAARDCTYVSLVPTMLHRLLEADVDLTRWKAILLGGDAAPAPLVERARDQGANVVRTYGMTETCGGVVYDGVPLDGVEVLVGDDGVVRLRTPTLMQGYRLDDGLTARVLEGDLYRTGDVGRFEEGRLTIVGREDDAIVSGGEKVFPLEVERTLLEHPGIEGAKVFGEEDEEWGRRVVARVKTRLQEVEVRAFLKERLARYKVPSRIEIEDDA